MDLCEAEPRDFFSTDVYTLKKLDDSTWSKMICRFPSWFERRKWVDMTGRYRYETWNTDKELREKLIDGDGTRTFRCVGIRSDDDHFIIQTATSSSWLVITHFISILTLYLIGPKNLNHIILKTVGIKYHLKFHIWFGVITIPFL